MPQLPDLDVHRIDPVTHAVLTDGAGVSTHVLGPIDPAGATTITATVVFVGTNVTGEPCSIGEGGDDPTFFYDPSSNAADFRSVELP